jgi:replication factor A1
MGGSSSFILNPDIPETHFLSGWFAQSGDNLQVESLSSGKGAGGMGQFMSMAEARDARLGMGEKADYYTTKATFIFFKKDGNVLYPGCKGCMKKLIDEGNGYYRCEKCNTSTNEFDWRSILTANIADWSDNCWATLFNETAEQVLNIPMQQLGTLKESGDEQAYTNVFAGANFSSALLKMRVKMESYNDETRLKHILQAVTPINPVEHGHRLLTDIDRILTK